MTVRYKGYEAMQSDYNNHVMIVKDGRTVMHVPHRKKLSAKELRGEIELCIMIRDDDSFGSSPSSTDEVGGPPPACQGGGAVRNPVDVLIALACCSSSKLSCEQCPFQNKDPDKCNAWTDDEIVEAVRYLRRMRGEVDGANEGGVWR